MNFLKNLFKRRDKVKRVCDTDPELDRLLKRHCEKIKRRKIFANIGRNSKCPCLSGKKYKHCCLNK